MSLVRTFFLLLFPILSLPILAQQEGPSSMFWNSYSYFNPANSGMNYDRFFNLQYRDQWTGFDKNPKTLWAIADFKVDPAHGGVGFNYQYDQIGNMKENKINGNYNFQGVINENHTISFGLSLGVHTQKFEDDWVSNTPAHLDPAIPSEEINATVFNVNTGLLYKFKDFQFGFSVLNLNEAVYNYSGTARMPKYMHFYLMSSYKIDLGENLTLNPNVIYVSMDKLLDEAIANSYYLNLNFIIYQKVWLGASYRKDEQLTFIGGIEFFEKLRLLYAYDPPNSNSLDEPSHEASISYFIERE